VIVATVVKLNTMETVTSVVMNRVGTAVVAEKSRNNTVRQRNRNHLVGHGDMKFVRPVNVLLVSAITETKTIKPRHVLGFLIDLTHLVSRVI